jgi:hypothetical protein
MELSKVLPGVAAIRRVQSRENLAENLPTDSQRDAEDANV